MNGSVSINMNGQCFMLRERRRVAHAAIKPTAYICMKQRKTKLLHIINCH